MTSAHAEEQLFRLASDDARMYEDARRWFLEQDPSIASALVEGLDDASLGSVGQWRILLLLRELALPSTLPAILKAFRSALAAENWIVLPGAMEALAIFDSEDAIAALQEAANSGDPDTANHAAALLSGRRG